MEYIIKNPEVLGEVVSLYSIAEVKAKRMGMAGGKGLHRPTYESALKDYIGQVTHDASEGYLITCNHRGIGASISTLMEAKTIDCGEDKALTIALNTYVRLKDLNLWANSYGDHYTVNHEKAWWIDERGIVGPGGKLVAMKMETCTDSIDIFITEVVPTIVSDPKSPSRRSDLLTHIIEAAKRQCGDPSDASAVFVVLREWARESPPRPPLMEVMEDGIIRWLDDREQPRELTKKKLSDRLRTRRKAA